MEEHISERQVIDEYTLSSADGKNLTVFTHRFDGLADKLIEVLRKK